MHSKYDHQSSTDVALPKKKITVSLKKKVTVSAVETIYIKDVECDRQQAVKVPGGKKIE